MVVGFFASFLKEVPHKGKKHPLKKNICVPLSVPV